MKAEFAPVAGLDGVYVARSGKLSCTALRLRDGSLCLYSPVAGLESIVQQQLGELGEVSVLLAPNHYHNKGLAAHAGAFPSAALCCSAAAKPRLAKLTGLQFNTLARLRDNLQEGTKLHEPPGLKTGEIWMQIKSATDRALAVTDAFSSPVHPCGTLGDKAGMLGSFPRYGVGDVDMYKTWATDFITTAAPTVLLPCHGSPVRSAQLAEQIICLLDETF